MLGARLDMNMERVILLRDYPNVLYLNAFDALVQAGGYNSFHEARQVRIPTLFLPNMRTGMDDQLARTRFGEQEGWAVVNQDRTKSGLEQSLASLWNLEPTVPDSFEPWSKELVAMLTVRSEEGLSE